MLNFGRNTAISAEILLLFRPKEDTFGRNKPISAVSAFGRNWGFWIALFRFRPKLFRLATTHLTPEMRGDGKASLLWNGPMEETSKFKCSSVLKRIVYAMFTILMLCFSRRFHFVLRRFIAFPPRSQAGGPYFISVQLLRKCTFYAMVANLSRQKTFVTQFIKKLGLASNPNSVQVVYTT